jgi:hypothetical protein
MWEADNWAQRNVIALEKAVREANRAERRARQPWQKARRRLHDAQMTQWETDSDLHTLAAFNTAYFTIAA